MTVEGKGRKASYDEDYKKANYDRIMFRVKKGVAGTYKSAAEKLGIGQSEFHRSAAEEFIQTHLLEGAPLPMKTPKPTESFSTADKALVAEFNQLPADVQKSIRQIIQAFNRKSTTD